MESLHNSIEIPGWILEQFAKTKKGPGYTLNIDPEQNNRTPRRPQDNHRSLLHHKQQGNTPERSQDSWLTINSGLNDVMVDPKSNSSSGGFLDLSSNNVTWDPRWSNDTPGWSIYDPGSTLDPGWNSTTEEPGTPQWLYTLYNTIAVAMVIFIMLAMGCGIEWATVKPHIRRPVGPIIGIFKVANSTTCKLRR